MRSLDVYTDGGCHGNPGPGGWAYVVLNGNSTITGSGGRISTTNNQMELTAVIEALSFVTEQYEKTSVRVHTDSEYVKNGITSWINTWKRNGWKTAARKPVKNQELWVTLDERVKNLSVEWEWVRGHSGNTYNEQCDRLVQEAIARTTG
ncbi:MAG: ribonuclease HI [Spirochaetaceae bacterium]|nr:MAG: ribonuclease HI [Spirochaetaceae bacterium]